MPEEAPEIPSSESLESNPIYILKDPFELDGHIVKQLSLDFSSVKSKQHRQLVSMMQKKVHPDLLFEFLSAPQIHLEYKIGLVAKVNGIIFDDLDNNLSLRDVQILGLRVTSFLMQ